LSHEFWKNLISKKKKGSRAVAFPLVSSLCDLLTQQNTEDTKLSSPLPHTVSLASRWDDDSYYYHASSSSLHRRFEEATSGLRYASDMSGVHKKNALHMCFKKKNVF
jgi:hypothetical protein